MSIQRDNIRYLRWRGPLRYPNLVSIKTLGDGSCFFHAVCNAFFVSYRKEEVNGHYMSKNEIVRKFRKELADRLGQKVDPNNINSPTYYDTLGSGYLSEYSKHVRGYSLQELQRELNSNSPVNHVYLEFISDAIEHDIYLLDEKTQDIYRTGDRYELLYKGRPSIMVLYTGGHYETIGVDVGSDIVTCLRPEDGLIELIKRRLNSRPM
ncbi:Hypothetical protein ORPV_1040 [Orpheovirus IHUMI-LCC2]|uniref:OTU domain-containing protein n=1 Tax=Orpheovirus IHUMI-LCC2 TaxID=2023057 RepID=A0A2I2L5X8_9VIRU|nr:Hypothetical protein ORPV_1040 [Orpheovirus IHUMI-LCC2]SNW62944.1 Hypothetical protein ORPV_1040 [Orpheovirus IHUMI-LCC2]